MTNSIVLDAWTILAYLNGRKNVINTHDLSFERASRGEVKLAISWINVGEVEYILKRTWGNDEAQAVLDRLKLLPVEWFEVTPERIHFASDVKAKGAFSTPTPLSLHLPVNSMAKSSPAILRSWMSVRGIVFSMASTEVKR